MADRDPLVLPVVESVDITVTNTDGTAHTVHLTGTEWSGPVRASVQFDTPGPIHPPLADLTRVIHPAFDHLWRAGRVRVAVENVGNAHLQIREAEGAERG